jgi:hypothetical protein
MDTWTVVDPSFPIQKRDFVGIWKSKEMKELILRFETLCITTIVFFLIIEKYSENRIFKNNIIQKNLVLKKYIC